MLRLQYVDLPKPKATLPENSLLLFAFVCSFLWVVFCCCFVGFFFNTRRISWTQIIAILLLQPPKFLNFWLEIQNVWLKLHHFFPISRPAASRHAPFRLPRTQTIAIYLLPLLTLAKWVLPYALWTAILWPCLIFFSEPLSLSDATLYCLLFSKLFSLTHIWLLWDWDFKTGPTVAAGRDSCVFGV